MNKIYLPDIKSIRVRNYSLYPNGLDFKYEFVHGVNLIVGGNGMGKTTFVNLLRYGLIGLYKKDFGFTRTYLGKKIEKRKELSSSYFSNRVIEDPELEHGELKIVFRIDESNFTVTRRLQDFALTKVEIDNGDNTKILEGSIISHSKYQRIDSDEKKQFLPYSYEEAISKTANVYSFDDFIFFVNEILYFGEDRKIILWDEAEEEIQERLFSKYFNDPELDNKREEAGREAQYYDSLSRHKSVDIKRIRDIIKKFEYDSEEQEKLKSAIGQLSKLKKDLDRQQNKMDKLHADRLEEVEALKVIRNSRAKKTIEIERIEAQITDLERKELKDTWIKLNPKYHIFLNDLTNTHHCPMCSQKMPESKLESITSNSEACFLCEQPIKKENSKEEKQTPKEINGLKSNLKKLLAELRGLELETVKIESEIEKLDDSYKHQGVKVFDLEDKVRRIEHAMQTDSDKSGQSHELRTLSNEIDKLEIQKKKLAKKSKFHQDKADELSKIIEEQNTKITSQLSKRFSRYAEKFLGVKCYLTYDDFKDGRGRRFVPVIDDKPRLNSEALSESQRFFIEHSYRMSILEHFYQKPSFFICETPDSSLDISYERNAVDIFLQYLEKPNSLVITTNLNNSDFLKYIMDKAENLGIVNLFDIGKRSVIQNASPQLRKLIKDLNQRINAK